MIVGGEIRFSGAVNGVSLNPSRTVSIVPRDWTGQVSFPTTVPDPKPSDQLQYPPVLVRGAKSEGVFGLTTYSTVTKAHGLMLGTGPNAGWWALATPPEGEDFTIHINPGLYPGDPFFRLQTGGSGYCDRAFMDLARRFVERHERRHAQIAIQFWHEDGTWRMLEDAKFWNPRTEGTYKEVADALTESARTSVKQRQDAFDNTSVLQIPCDLHALTR